MSSFHRTHLKWLLTNYVGNIKMEGWRKVFLCLVFFSISNGSFPSLFIWSCAYHPHLLLLKSFLSSPAWLKCFTQSVGAVDKCTKKEG